MINKRSNQADTNVTVQSKQLSLELGDYGGKPRLAPMIISQYSAGKAYRCVRQLLAICRRKAEDILQKIRERTNTLD